MATKKVIIMKEVGGAGVIAPSSSNLIHKNKIYEKHKESAYVASSMIDMVLRDYERQILIKRVTKLLPQYTTDYLVTQSKILTIFSNIQYDSREDDQTYYLDADQIEAVSICN
jgi:hypothetical protein